MNIEEAIENLKIYMKLTNEQIENGELFLDSIVNTEKIQIKSIETLLTAYEKEKEKNKELKWKPIKDYNRKKYDWVLVKYFDGDYECVPEVAEKRCDGKWYTSEKQIPFEVKYFFDMQEILEEE